MNLHLSKQARKGLLQVEFMQQTCEYYVQAKRIFWKLGSPRFRWVLHTSMHLIHPTQQNLELLCILGGGLLVYLTLELVLKPPNPSSQA